MYLSINLALCVAGLLVGTTGQAPGDGISKSTYASSSPISGMNFLLQYFPMVRPGDECTNDVCDCGDWEISQGRLFALTSKTQSTCYVSPGCGFGLASGAL